jgi:hypothetical protein
MTTKAEINAQMDALIRRPPRAPHLRVVSENGQGRIVATEPEADNDGARGDDANTTGARNDDQ